MSKTIYMMLTVLVVSSLVNAAAVSSPWDHHGSELTTPITIVPGTSPIQYTSAFNREREIYGYNPRFMPMPVVFDKDNRPFILTDVPAGNTVGSHLLYTNGSSLTTNAYLQTLDNSGNWVTYSIMDIMREVYGQGSPYYSPSITAGYKWEDRIFFDDDNNIFFTMISESPDVSGTVIVYSNDGKQSWQSLHLNYIYNTSVETFDSFASNERDLPTICHYKAVGTDRLISLYQLGRDPISGNLTTGGTTPIVGAQGKYGPGHSGFLNYTITIGQRVHFFWLDQLNQAPGEQTRQYHNYYDKQTGFISTPTLLGSTVGTWYGDAEPYVPVDPHNGATVTVDRNKTMHVVLGGHGTQAKYTYSTDQGVTWAAAVNLPGGNAYNTYPTLITDRDGTVHLVYRATISSGNYQLAYSRMKAGQGWEDMGALVVPGNDGYSIYYHTMTVDRLGRIFLQYYYRADTMSEADKAEYRAKWPTLPDPDVQIYTFDPVIIMSDNGGDTWKIATTADFANGLISDSKPVICSLFDSVYDPGIDMAGYDNNFDVTSGQPATVSGIVGSGAGFDGVDDAIRAELLQGGEFTTGAFTVTGWFKLASQPSALSNLVYAKTDSRGFGLSVNNGQWIAYTYADGYSDSATASQPTTAGQWTHIAFTYSPSGDPVSGTYTGTTKVYVNGQLAATGTNKKYNPNGTNQITLGVNGGSNIGFTADEFAVFSGAMPAQKIAELAANEFRPSNVSRELLYKGDFNADGLVNANDLTMFAGSWLEGN